MLQILDDALGKVARSSAWQTYPAEMSVIVEVARARAHQELTQSAVKVPRPAQGMTRVEALAGWRCSLLLAPFLLPLLMCRTMRRR